MSTNPHNNYTKYLELHNRFTLNGLLRIPDGLNNYAKQSDEANLEVCIYRYGTLKHINMYGIVLFDVVPDENAMDITH